MSAIGLPNDSPAWLARIGRGNWVGRAREMVEANALWQQAVSGEGRVLLISGDPGVGKTRFARELSTIAQSGGGLALTGECDAEGSLPYAPLAAIITGYFEAPGEAATDLPDETLTNLGALVPTLRQRFPGRIPDPIPDPPSAQQRISEGFLRFCRTLSAGQPLLIFIDDAQWADHDTLSILRSLARAIRRLPVLIVMTYREAELESSPPLNQLLLDLNHERLAAHLALAPLDPEETAELLKAMFSTEAAPEFLAGVYAETEGNPFFIEEVCKSLIETGQIAYRDGHWHYPSMGHMQTPQTVRAAIQGRLRQLPEMTQDVLRMAAILGREFDFRTLQQATRLEEEVLIRALESALKAQIILEIPSNPAAAARFKFVHVLIPTTLRESIIQIRRQRLHIQAAQAIDAIRPGDYEALAYQFTAAGELGRAGGYYKQAGDRARQAAPAEAARFYRAALDDWPAEDPAGQAEITARLGYCMWVLGDIPEALKWYEEAYRRYDRLQNRIQSGDMQRMMGRLYWELADREHAREHYQLAYAILEKEPESPELARAIGSISQMYMLVPENEQAIAWGQRALEMAGRLGLEDVAVHTLNTIGTCYSETGDFERGMTMLQESLRRSLAANLPQDVCRAYYNLGVMLHRQCRYADARELLLALHTYAAQVYMKNNANLAIWLLMWMDWLTGNWGSALVYRSQMAPFSSRIYQTWARRISGMIDLDLGRMDAGLGELEDSLPNALRANDKQTTFTHLGQLARAYAMSGQDSKMTEIMRQALDFISNSTITIDETFVPLLIACQHFARRSPTGAAEAKACIDLYNRHEQKFSSKETAAALAEAMGCLVEKTQPATAAGHFRVAAEAWEKMDRPYDQARALSSLYSALAACGDQPSARLAGNQALRLFNHLAAPLDPESQAVFLNTPDPQFLRQSLAETPRQKVDDLTGREIEVLRLVAQGLTNPQIAERLVISPLTVNAHLRSIFNKLDVTSRTGATRVAMDRGLV